MNTLKSRPRHCDEWYTRGLEDADCSKWSHRAWTVQEKALSRRTLVFTDEQVFWTCQQAYFCEESDFEVSRFRVKHYYPSVHKLGIHQLTGTSSDPWRNYKDLIQNYTALSTFPMTSLKKRVTFPTWSWMGWAGDVHCRADDSRRER